MVWLCLKDDIMRVRRCVLSQDMIFYVTEEPENEVDPNAADVITGIELEAMFGAITGLCFFCSSKLGCVRAKELLRFDSSIT